MTAQETFDKRADLVEQLTAVDLTLEELLGREPSLRLTADVRSLFDSREQICDELRIAGFEPWRFMGATA
jgi:hypothetical protein